jgi:hypothetical protein
VALLQLWMPLDAATILCLLMQLVDLNADCLAHICLLYLTQVKLPSVSSNPSSRTSSPARPWKPSAPGALSPGIAGTMPPLPGTSPSPSNASPMLRATLSARGAATASTGEYGRLLALHEDAQLVSGLDTALFSSSPMNVPTWLQQQHSNSSSSGGGNNSSGGGGFSSSSSSGGGSSGVPFGLRAPSGSSGGSSYLGGLGREGTESPSRPRRALSAPGTQLQQLAMQQLQQQKAAGAVGSCDSATNSPRFSSQHRSSLAARVGQHPNFTGMSLDVNAAAAAAAASPDGQLPSSGPTPGSACDTPDSQSSPHVRIRPASMQQHRCLPG